MHYYLDGKQLQEQYKDYLSDYHQWDQKSHAHQWLLYPDNVDRFLSIDETSLSNGELYTLVTNKAAKGGKGTIVAMVRGTKAEDIVAVLNKLPKRVRWKVREVTMDMAANMEYVIKICFPQASRVTDRFHVQQLAYDAVQELRIKHRWNALDRETIDMALAKACGRKYNPPVLANGDTLKQLLARSRYLLFKKPTAWTYSQKTRAEILFELYPDLKKAYHFSLQLGAIYHQTKDKGVAFAKLAQWYDRVDNSGILSFGSITRTIQSHYLTILNYFNHRSTNASAESFNAKIKAFRASFRGVRDVNFFLFRLTKIYA
ncbi:ISAon1 family transposase [Microbacter margulisiae]|uniref:Transposase n=1 Tax=Microbacter margulisiae TaxID=1350067 RepID=A0A7W5H328_9PORP|nr:transposase [Microbacter margulisiae]